MSDRANEHASGASRAEQANERSVRENHQTEEQVHYGTKPGHFETLKIHCPTSEGVSEVSERANE